MVQEGMPSITTGKQCTQESKAEVYKPPTVVYKGSTNDGIQLVIAF